MQLETVCRMKAGKLEPVNTVMVEDLVENLQEGVDYLVTVKVVSEKKFISKNQNIAWKVWLTRIAKALNKAGLDQKALTPKDAPIEWDSESVKKRLWGRVMHDNTGKTNTAHLSKKEFQQVADNFALRLSRKGVDVPWPTKDD